MVVAAQALGIHYVLCGAAGGMSDPTQVRVADLVDVSDDALLRSVRQELRKKHGYPPGVGLRKAGRKARSKPWGVPCVYSLESAGSAVQVGGGTLCDRFGTACFATGAFGFAAAAHLTAAIARGDAPQKPPRIATEDAVPEEATPADAKEQKRPRSGGVQLLACVSPEGYALRLSSKVAQPLS